MNASPNREVALFSAALELPTDQRAAYLDQACADDPALRQRLEELVRVHEEAITFLHTPARGAPESPLGTEVAGATVRLSNSPAEKAGDRIGRYKLLQQIGEGGCGIVYMAEQEEPVRRRVALKVIKLGMDTKQVIARFQAERQALALMDHPNIAQVFDAGATETGRPYFVMELVRGIKITDYCDENNLPTTERLKLFVQVCHAIQHAHQKGIIHRDIKPSNILVASNDGVPVPKVIDFGIAKATQGRLTDQTVFTAFEQFIGTPAYMSPEQAELTMLDIDTRTDIYSLGVLLYELLTGRTPLDQKDLTAAGLDEMRRTIREREPVRPSTRLSTMLEGELTSAAKHRHTDAPKLIHLLRGDLDWIVMKALEKDRARRYETANGLAMDIGRHLNNEPVVARPPSKLYRFQKLARRNKLAFAAAGAVAAALITGLTASTWEYLKERKTRQRAVAVNAFLQKMLTAPDPNRQGFNAKISDVLALASKALETDFQNQPDVQADIRETIGRTYHQSEMHRLAEHELRTVLSLRQQALGAEHKDTLRAMESLASFLLDRSRPAEAESLLRGVLAVRERVLGAEHADTISARLHLADTLAMMGRWPEAEPLATRTLFARIDFLTASPPASVTGFDNRCAIFASSSVAAAAHLAYERRLRELESSLGPNDPRTITTSYLLALVLWRRDQKENAMQMLDDVQKRVEAVLGVQHPYALYTVRNLADMLGAKGDWGAAEAGMRQFWQRRKARLGEDHPATLTAMSHAVWYVSRRGNIEEAISLREALLKMTVRVLGEEHASSIFQMTSLGGLYMSAARKEEGEAMGRRALALSERWMGDDDNMSVRCRENLVRILRLTGKAAEAEQLDARQQEIVARIHRSGAPSGLPPMPAPNIQVDPQTLRK